MATSPAEVPQQRRGGISTYEKWIQSQGIPIHRAFFIDDLRTLEVGWWEFRQCHAAFIVLAGQEDIQESRVTAIPAGESVPPSRISLEEMVYCVQGHGLCTVWAGDRE
jgi:hypothetical protein